MLEIGADAVAPTFQHALDQKHLCFVVVDVEDVLAAALAGRARFPGWAERGRHFTRVRKIQLEPAALAGFAVRDDRAFVRLHDAMHHRQAQPRALACRLGGKERLEDPPLRRCIHAVSGVADHDACIPARPQVQIEPGRGLVQGDAFNADIDATGAALHRVRGVIAQVQEHLLHLRRVGHNGRRIGGAAALDPHASGQRGAQQTRGFLRNRGQRHHAARGRLAPAERQYLLHQIAGAVPGLLNFVQAHQRLPIGSGIVARQFGIAQNGPEDIVEVMRDPPRQGSDRLHFLRFAQLGLERRVHLLGLFALGDVLKRPFDAGDLAVGIPHCLADGAHVEPAAFGGEYLQFAIEGRAIASAGLQRA